MTTAQQVFESAIALMDSLSENGTADYADNKEYKDRTLKILNILRGELYPYSDTRAADATARPVASLIRSMDAPIDLDDTLCQTVLPYGLAAHLLLGEDPTTANYFQQRYDELKQEAARTLPAVSEDIVDVYGGFPYNDFGSW